MPPSARPCSNASWTVSCDGTIVLMFVHVLPSDVSVQRCPRFARMFAVARAYPSDGHESTAETIYLATSSLAVFTTAVLWACVSVSACQRLCAVETALRVKYYVYARGKNTRGPQPWSRFSVSIFLRPFAALPCHDVIISAYVCALGRRLTS